MRNIARLNDVTVGTCYHPSHTIPVANMKGKIISGDSTVTVDGRPVARINDIVQTKCGHYDYIVGYRNDVFGSKREFARINDSVGKKGIYIGKIVSASGTTSTL